jgi:hypothetical protein
VCDENIGTTLFFPNLFNYSIIESEETLTEADCANVAQAIIGSGMDSTADFCPNIVCQADNQYDCEWGNCSAADTTLYYEDYDYYMGASAGAALTAVCAAEGQTSTYARVFEQDPDVDALSVSCIQFGYFMNGQVDVTLSLYMDSDGGEPDDAMALLGSMTVTSINAVGQFQVQTASFLNAVEVRYANAASTLVVVMSTPAMAQGSIVAGGTPSPELVDTIGDTYVGGDCVTGYQSYFEYANSTVGLDTKASNQWFVKLSASTAAFPSSSSSNDDDELSDGAIAGIAVGALAGLAIIGVAAYCLVKSMAGSSAAKEPLMESSA